MLKLYVETAVQLEPLTSDTVVNLSLPASSLTNLPLLSNSTPSRPISTKNPNHAKDEASFVKQHLSSHGSVYFRQARTYPRTFLWRVLEDDRLLELRCADLAKSEHEPGEAYLTLRFNIQHQIVPGGVALSDVPDQDVLSIFLITSNKELHTLAVPLDFFRFPGASNVNSRAWSKSFVPSSFTIDTPHRLYAYSPFQLFVSLDSGRIQRLTRKAGDDGSQWTQLSFDDKSWGASIRDMVKWHSSQSIQHDSRYFSQTTANAMLASSDATYLYTICLNHTLRIWNLATGRLEVSRDLLDRVVRPQDPPTVLSPATPSCLHLCQVDAGEQPMLLTFSPHNEGQFKFWGLRGGLLEPVAVEDMFPQLSLKPPDPDPSGNTIWSLAGFETRSGSINEPMELWLLWRNNNLYQLYSLRFDLQDPSDAWTRNWVKTHILKGPNSLPPDFVRADPCDPSEKWLNFLFFPKRYPTSTLETSLSIYREAMRIKVVAADTTKPLQERVCACIASTVHLRKQNELELDFTRFAMDTDTQWRNYWRTVEALNEKRRSPVSLALDRYADMAWVLQSDQCCAIRECNALETVGYNSPDSLQHHQSLFASRWPFRRTLPRENDSLQKMNELFDVARNFSQSFTPELSRDCETALGVEISHEAECSIPSRINEFYQRCDFGDAVSNEICKKVFAGVERIGGLQALGKNLLPAVLALVPGNIRGSHTALRSTLFGSTVVDAGLCDVIHFGRQIIYDLFLLVVFLECEVDQDGSGPETFDAAPLFVEMLAILKEHEKKIWLLSRVRGISVDPGDNPAKSSTIHETNPSLHRQKLQVTLLRDTRGKDIRPQPAVELAQSHLLTEMLNDIEAWVGGASEISADDGYVWIQCDLLAHGEVALASSFFRFQPDTPWSTYVRGRLLLVRGDYEQAALAFQRGAYSLGKAHGKAVGMLTDMSAGLLSEEDTDYFNNGVSCYFQHILTLFKSAKAYSFAADFARLALAAMHHDDMETKADRDDLLASLFAAELHCSRYASAFSALTRMANEQVQKGLTVAWVDAVLGLNSSPQFLEATDVIRLLQRLPLDLHPILAQMMDERFTTLAQRQTSIPGPSGHIWPHESKLDYLRVLYALRLGRQDYRGAVSVMMDRLQLVKKSSQARNDPRATALRHTLLALINVMSCLAPDEAYILSSVEQKIPDQANGLKHADDRDMETGWKPQKKAIITLENLRHEYQQLLDKCSRIERGDFDFDAGADDQDDEEGERRGYPRSNSTDPMEF